MAGTLSGNYTRRVSAIGNYINDLTINDATQPISVSQSETYTQGAGSNKANSVYTVYAELAAGATDSIDLAGGVTDAFGNVLTFTEIKGFSIQNHGAATGLDLEIGGNATPFEHWISAAGLVYVGAGGAVSISSPIDGYAVGGGATDVLDIKNTGGTDFYYTLEIIGEA